MTRVGKFKVRLGHPGSNYVEKYTVWQEGDKLFISRNFKTPVRKVDPPQDYPGRRSEGLIEYEVIR